MSFDQFWSAYPIKKAKKKARAAWDKYKLDDMADTIIAHVEMMLITDKLWKIGIGIPHPTTYINQERWEDEPEIEQERERQVRLPRDDHQLESFAREHGLPMPGAGQTYFEYRKVLQQKLENRNYQ